MKAMIFAAGLGTRLKPLTDRMPKALVPLAGKTLLQWQVEKLRDAGIRDIVVNVHHFPDMIIDAIRQNEGWGCNISVSDERDCLLETGGGLKKAFLNGLLSTEDNEPILACNVDILSNIDLSSFIDAYDPNTLGLLVVSPRDTQRYLLFDDGNALRGWMNVATGEVRPKTLADDPKTANFLTPFAFSGMQILNPRIGKVMDERDKFSLIDLYLHACEKEVLKAYFPQNYRMMDVGKIDQLAEAERFAESLN